MRIQLPIPSEIEELTSFLPRLYAKGFNPVKKWGGGTKDQDGVITLPWPEYEEVVQEFFEVASRECWSDYYYCPADAAKILENESLIKSADLSQIKTLLTCCVRGEHFCDGYWGAMIEEGKIRRLLQRLIQLFPQPYRKSIPMLPANVFVRKTCMRTLKNKLIEICKTHTLPRGADVVIKEPYIPFIPENWNGTLVLAESQNLSKKNFEYVNYLNGIGSLEMFSRLNDPNNLGIQPWDDGSLKLAVQSAFLIKATEVAVSNSVVWSQVTEDGRNKNPSKQLVKLASLFWSDILSVLGPDLIITSGKIASNVINAVEKKPWKHIRLRLPSPMAMSRISGMFPEEDLLLRYPEVNAELCKNPEWGRSGFRQNKIFFACHAVSIMKSINAKEDTAFCGE